MIASGSGSGSSVVPHKKSTASISTLSTYNSQAAQSTTTPLRVICPKARRPCPLGFISRCVSIKELTSGRSLSRKSARDFEGIWHPILCASTLDTQLGIVQALTPPPSPIPLPPRRSGFSPPVPPPARPCGGSRVKRGTSSGRNTSSAVLSPAGRRFPDSPRPPRETPPAGWSGHGPLLDLVQSP